VHCFLCLFSKLRRKNNACSYFKLTNMSTKINTILHLFYFLSIVAEGKGISIRGNWCELWRVLGGGGADGREEGASTSETVCS
jgi:hypothetical protein